MPDKKTIRVVGALIRDGGRIFAAERAYGFLKGKWELPGGKIEPGETPEQAIVREIKEELNTTVRVIRFFANVQYEYPEFNLDMDVFECSVIDGRLSVTEGIHLAEAWIEIDKIDLETWCPADRFVLKELF